MSRHIRAGIDIGSHATRAVIIENDGEKQGFRVLGTGIAKSMGVRHGYVTNPKEAGESVGVALALAQKTAQIKIRRALLGVGGQGLEGVVGGSSQIISRVDGEVGNLDIKHLVATARESASLVNKRVIREFPILFKLDNKEVLGDPVGMHGNKLEAKVLFVTSLEQHFDSLVRSAEYAGVIVEDVVPSLFAASLVTLTKAQRTAGCVLANVGSETISIVVFEDDRPISLQVFPLGGVNITNDIALGLRISLEEAESIKIGEQSAKEYSQKKIDEIIEARLRDMFDLIETHLKKINKSGLLPAGIIFTGESAKLRMIEDLAKTCLKLPARVAPQLSGEKNAPLSTSWASAYGLALLGFDDSYGYNPFPLTSLKDPLHNFFSWMKQFLP